MRERFDLNRSSQWNNTWRRRQQILKQVLLFRMIRWRKRESVVFFVSSPGDCCQVVSQRSLSPRDLPVGHGWHEKAFLNAVTWTWPEPGWNKARRVNPEAVSLGLNEELLLLTPWVWRILLPLKELTESLFMCLQSVNQGLRLPTSCHAKPTTA